MRMDLTGAPADSHVAWAVLTDTDWMNRVGGNGPMRDVSWKPREEGRFLTGVQSGLLGSGMSFVETKNHWVWHQVFRQHRTFTTGPLDHSHYEVRFEPVEAGVVPHLSLELAPNSALARPIVATVLRRIRSRWTETLRNLPGPAAAEGVAAAVRSLPPALQHGVERLHKLAPSAHVDRLAHLLASGRVSQLQNLRPYTLARDWGTDPDGLLESFLHATQAGLVELVWSLRCTRCHGQIARTTRLQILSEQGECASCERLQSADLSESVEVLFSAHPSLVPQSTESFCTMNPAGSPEIAVSTFLRSEERQTIDVALPPGQWRLGVHGEADQPFTVAPESDTTSVSWPPNAAPSDTSSLPADGRGVQLHLHNPSKTPSRFMVVAERPPNAFVSAARVSTFPQFRRSMGTELLSPGARLSTRSVTALFTDLTDSTAMYEHLGDAAAFAFVRDHFDILTRCIEREQGIVVKTIGDAVMAVFHQPEAGLRCSVHAVREFNAWAASKGLDPPPALKLGLHTGPALVVHSDQYGLDFFGASINVAARVQGQALRNQIAMTEAVHEHPAIQAVLSQEGLAAHAIDSHLKGIEGTFRLLRIQLA